MREARSLIERVLSAIITAAGVVLLAAGSLALTTPAAGAPGASATPTSATASATPAPTAARPPGPTAASPSPSPGTARPTRVVIASLRIDLPVVATQTGYPLCDVAQYLLIPGDKMGLPGVNGITTYVYAHARQGMFLPLLTSSQVANGDALIGSPVQLYTDDDKLYSYVITTVKRHTTDFALASSVGPDEQRLILQTSEGPAGTIPKLQVAATLLSVAPAAHGDAHPAAKPRVCG
ncbi:MAG: hypothetical protein ACXVAP_04785 [Candidatus Limnocylindrales bacterium]